MITSEPPRVGLVVVSHSASLASGVAELAAQMAPDVAVIPAGGSAGGGLGTDFEAVSTALGQADGGAGVVLLYDLGSAKMVADLAVESLDEPDRALVVDAPLVEGAVAAAVAAQGRADLEGVAEAGAAAVAELMGEADQHAGVEPAPDEPAHAAEVRLTNEVGLHARPAALLARTVSDLDAEVTVRFGESHADARSVLALMALGTQGGDVVEVLASGPQAAEAIRLVGELADRGFDDVPPTVPG